MTIDKLCSTLASQAVGLASKPSMQNSINALMPFESSSILSRIACPITGIMMLSWKFPPAAPDKVMVASLPITLAVSCIMLSHITGLTLPGMIDEPGCRSGRMTSKKPQRGPEPNQRMLLAMLNKLMAMVLICPWDSTKPSRWALASK